MQIIPLEQIAVSFLSDSLREGKILVYPTETCYGLGCDATQNKAVDTVFRIKKREEGKSLLVIFPDVTMAMKYVEWDSLLEELSQKYWPGALTVVVPVKSNTELAFGVLGKDNTLAFRISSHPLVQELSRTLGAPLVSTSANIAGEENPYDAQEIIERFQKETLQPDIIIDSGLLPYCAPSTIVKIDNGKLHILRQGPVKIEESL